MAKWSLDLKNYANAKGEQIDTVRKNIAMTAYTSISARTPVDTGRARGNWQIGINKDPQDQLERKGFGSNEELPKLKLAKADDTIYISNNLPYINRLEYGSSKQSPNGMVGVTFEELKGKMQKIIDESKKK